MQAKNPYRALDPYLGKGRIVRSCHLEGDNFYNMHCTHDTIIFDADVTIEGETLVVENREKGQCIAILINNDFAVSVFSEPGKLSVFGEENTLSAPSVQLTIMTQDYFHDRGKGSPWASESVLSTIARYCGNGLRLVRCFASYTEEWEENVSLELRGKYLIVNGKPFLEDGLDEGAEVLLETPDGIVMKCGWGFRFAILKDPSWEAFVRLADAWSETRMSSNGGCSPEEREELDAMQKRHNIEPLGGNDRVLEIKQSKPHEHELTRWDMKVDVGGGVLHIKSKGSKYDDYRILIDKDTEVKEHDAKHAVIVRKEEDGSQTVYTISEKEFFKKTHKGIRAARKVLSAIETRCGEHRRVVYGFGSPFQLQREDVDVKLVENTLIVDNRVGDSLNIGKDAVIVKQSHEGVVFESGEGQTVVIVNDCSRESYRRLVEKL